MKSIALEIGSWLMAIIVALFIFAASFADAQDSSTPMKVENDITLLPAAAQNLNIKNTTCTVIKSLHRTIVVCTKN